MKWAYMNYLGCLPGLSKGMIRLTFHTSGITWNLIVRFVIALGKRSSSPRVLEVFVLSW